MKMTNLKQLTLSLGLLLSMSVPAQQDGNTADTLNAGGYDAEYRSMHRKITSGRLIFSYDLEVTFDKTVHILFPSPIKYVDLGSPLLAAEVAQGAENVLRIKASRRDFDQETNLSVITADGSFYSFNVTYSVYPLKTNIEMESILQSEKPKGNAAPVYLKELAGESPERVNLILSSIYRQDRRFIKNIGSKRFNISFVLKGIYTDGNLLYFHTEIKNASNLPFDVDFIRWKIVDKKTAKRTAIQETFLNPLSAFYETGYVGGRSREHTVWALQRFTIPDDKQLVVELFEKNGGRHQSFTIENRDIIHARTTEKLEAEYFKKEKNP